MNALKSQKRQSDPLDLGLYIDVYEPCGYWELNPGFLEEYIVLLTAQPSLQPSLTTFDSWLQSKDQWARPMILSLCDLNKLLLLHLSSRDDKPCLGVNQGSESEVTMQCSGYELKGMSHWQTACHSSPSCGCHSTCSTGPCL